MIVGLYFKLKFSNSDEFLVKTFYRKPMYGSLVFLSLTPSSNFEFGSRPLDMQIGAVRPPKLNGSGNLAEVLGVRTHIFSLRTPSNSNLNQIVCSLEEILRKVFTKNFLVKFFILPKKLFGNSSDFSL